MAGAVAFLVPASAFLTPAIAFGQSAAPVVVVQAPSTLVDLYAIVQPILAVIGATIAGLIAIYVPKAIAAFEKRTGIELTEDQRKTMIGAVQTAAGMVETKLDQGAMQLAHVNVANPQIRAEATAAINAVPVAAAALGMTVDGVSRMIVAATDTATHGVVPVVAGAPLVLPLVLGPAVA